MKRKPKGKSSGVIRCKWQEKESRLFGADFAFFEYILGFYTLLLLTILCSDFSWRIAQIFLTILAQMARR